MSAGLANHGELRELLTQLAVDNLDAQGERRLNEMLKHDATARDFYRRFQLVDALLQWEYAEPPAVERESRWSRAWFAVYDVVAQPISLAMIVSGLVITTILLTLALWRLPEQRPGIGTDAALQVAARITATHDATWDADSDANFKNVELFAGERLVLNSGLAEIVQGDGVRVILEGPATYVVSGTATGNLNQGRLTARIQAKQTGFRVHTPTATIIDIGTEFGVAVDERGETVAQVLEGEVEVRLIGQVAQKSVTLKAGESAKVTPGSDKIQKQDSESAFVRKLPPKLAPSPADWGTLIIDDDIEGSGDDSAIVGEISKAWSNWDELEPPYLNLLELAGDEDAAAGNSPKLAAVNGLAPHSYGGRRPSVTYRHKTQPGTYVVRLQMLNYSNAPFTGIEKVLLAGLAPVDAAKNPIPEPGDDEVWTYLYEVDKDSANRDLSLEIQALERDGSNWGTDHVQIYFRPTNAE